MKNSGGSSLSLNVNFSPTHSFSPERKPPQNVEGFKNYLKKYDKKELFQANSSTEIQMYGSEKLLERKKELQLRDHHQSLELSMESVESPENRRNLGGNFLRERNERFQRVAGNVIIPIQEFNKLEDVQTPQVIDRFLQVNKKTTMKSIRNDKKVFEEDSSTLNYIGIDEENNKNFRNDKKIVEEDSKVMINFRNDKKIFGEDNKNNIRTDKKIFEEDRNKTKNIRNDKKIFEEDSNNMKNIRNDRKTIEQDNSKMKNIRNDKKAIEEDDSTKILREYLANIKKQVIISDEKNLNNVSKMSDSLEFAVVNDKVKKSLDEDGGIFSVRNQYRK